MKVIGVSRGARYSPNHVGNDAAIFNQVMDCLGAAGCMVERYSEQEFLSVPMPDVPTIVVGMARDAHTLSKLHQWEEAGIEVVNSPRGVENCVRRPMTERLLQHGIPHPASWILSTAGADCSCLTFPCWVKRGDAHAMVKEDVSYAATAVQVGDILDGFRQRGIATAVVNEHLQGDLVKFYGVQDSPFFHWFYPSSGLHSKFGLEAINGMAKGYPFEVNVLKRCADDAARVLDVPIYGGDAVVMADGGIKLIDFNDWPSFAPCREEAGVAIARYVLERMRVSDTAKSKV